MTGNHQHAPAVIGREREAEEISAALDAGRDLLLEGPPGTSKSTLLRAAARDSGRAFVMVEGNADLTPSKLTGYHEPSSVIAHGYRPEDFASGPLLEAMRGGALLYVEELNRVPDDTLNVLLGPLSEREISVPRVGTVRAEPGFRLIAAMNPFDNVGTLRVSRSVLDRLCRLSIGYQDEKEEREISRQRSGGRNEWLIEGAVSMIRASRSREDLRMGSSVRGAIDLALVAEDLAQLRGIDLRAKDIRSATNAAKDVVLDAALISLSSRIFPDEASQRPPEAIIRELWEDVFYFHPQAARGEKTLDLENPISAPAGRPRKRRGHQGPVFNPRSTKEPSPQPKPGEAKEPPRTYSPNEMELLSSERAAGPNPKKMQDVRRDNPAAQEILDEEGQFDQEAFEDLYERDEEAAVSVLGDLWPSAADAKLRDLIRQMALKIVVRLARKNPTASTGRGKLRPVRYRFNSDDLDLDRTLEEIAGKPYPEYDDFWVTERMRTRKTYAMLLDVSGSMRGEKLMHVALAAGSLARNISDDDYSVVLFWRDAAVVKAAGQEKPFTEVLDDILSAQARGLTNLRHGLEVGLRELERASTQEKEAIIFTDGMHNIGEDPLPLVAKYPKLHVIGTSLEEGRVRACQELAERGGGRSVFVEHMQDIPAAVSYCMSDP